MRQQRLFVSSCRLKSNDLAVKNRKMTNDYYNVNLLRSTREPNRSCLFCNECLPVKCSHSLEFMSETKELHLTIINTQKKERKKDVSSIKESITDEPLTQLTILRRTFCDNTCHVMLLSLIFLQNEQRQTEDSVEETSRNKQNENNVKVFTDLRWIIS